MVSKKMDLSTIKRNLGRREYSSLDEFSDDALLIVSNCQLYNWADPHLIKAAVHLRQAWERFQQRAKELYPSITSAHLTSTRLEIPAMDRATYINDDLSGEEEAIQLPYILTAEQLRQAVAAERAVVHSGPGLRAIMFAVLDYMAHLDDQGLFGSPVCTSYCMIRQLGLLFCSLCSTAYCCTVGDASGLPCHDFQPYGFRHDAGEGGAQEVPKHRGV